MDKFVSKVSRANCSAESIYSRFENLEGVANAVHHEKIEHVEASRDECHVTVKGMGTLGVRIVDREPFKTIKFTDIDGQPISFTLWIQFVEVDSRDTRIRLTLHAEIPVLLRFMLKKKIQSGLDQAAEQIASTFSR